MITALYALLAVVCLTFIWLLIRFDSRRSQKETEEEQLDRITW
jgi:flagellar biogenesis protein FliO